MWTESTGSSRVGGRTSSLVRSGGGPLGLEEGRDGTTDVRHSVKVLGGKVNLRKRHFTTALAAHARPVSHSGARTGPSNASVLRPLVVSSRVRRTTRASCPPLRPVLPSVFPYKPDPKFPTHPQVTSVLPVTSFSSPSLSGSPHSATPNPSHDILVDPSNPLSVYPSWTSTRNLGPVSRTRPETGGHSRRRTRGRSVL